MTIRKDKKYRTADERTVIIYSIHEDQAYPVHGAIWFSNGRGWQPAKWTQDGSYLGDRTHAFDLVEVRPERVLWVNEDEDGHIEVWHTRDYANGVANDNRLALHRVVLNEDTVWREGDDE